MSHPNSLSRRSFFKDVASAGAGATVLQGAPAVLAQRSPANVL
ncbi:MAG: twin-arginine translocation signal domain-containing protein, partial [Bryobacteraceae bacterium]|nr:twin-arginine translocation signal domain-containing protein [Bryobacteraceae bacterium]